MVGIRKGNRTVYIEADPSKFAVKSKKASLPNAWTNDDRLGLEIADGKVRLLSNRRAIFDEAFAIKSDFVRPIANPYICDRTMEASFLVWD